MITHYTRDNVLSDVLDPRVYKFSGCVEDYMERITDNDNN